MSINVEEYNQREFIRRTKIVSFMLLVIIVFAIIIGVISWPQRTINKIEHNIGKGNYETAEELIEQYQNRFENADLTAYSKITSYNIAKAAAESGNSQDARYRLEELGDYENTKELLKECDYLDADALLKDEKYEDANAMFTALKGYKDSDEKVLQCRYQIAMQIYESGDFGKALDLFLSLGDYQDSKAKADTLAMQVTGTSNIQDAYSILEGMNSEEIQKIAHLTAQREKLPVSIIAIGLKHTVGLKDDGTVLSAGLNNEGQCDVGSWSNVVAIDAGAEHTVGLTSDGKVLAEGRNTEGQCDVGDWSGIVAIAAGDYNTYGLKSDGTVLSAGFTEVDTAELSNIKYIGAGSYAAAFIDGAGQTTSTHQSMFIGDLGAVQVDVSTGYIIALMPAGGVSATIDGTKDWEDIMVVSAGTNMVLGIKSDGTLAAHFFRERDSFDTSYENVVGIAAGGAHSAIVLSDGSVIAFGENDFGQCDVGDWDLITEDVAVS